MQYKFTLNGFGGPRAKPLAQDRYIGMNRVVSGMFMFQTRRNKVESSNRFDDLYEFVYEGGLASSSRLPCAAAGPSLHHSANC